MNRTVDKLQRLRRALAAFRNGAAESRRLRQVHQGPPPLWDTFPITSQAALSVFRHLGIELVITGAPVSREPQLMVGNHVSWLDPIALGTVAPTSFVTRADTQHWPFFGTGLKAFGTIFVNRTDKASRQLVRERIQEAIVQEGRMVGVFPEGTTSLAGRPWRRGVFELAANAKIPLQAFRVRYEPARAVAYIDDDTFVRQFWSILGLPRIRAWIEVREPMTVTDPEKTRAELEAWAQEWGTLMRDTTKS